MTVSPAVRVTVSTDPRSTRIATSTTPIRSIESALRTRVHGVKAHLSFRHEALLYRNSHEFLETIIPFIRDGLALQQPVMVAVVGPRVELIRGALGSSAADVVFIDMYELGRNPARIIPASQKFIDAFGDRPIRAVGEPIWAGRSGTEIAECQLHEGLMNVVIPPDTPLWLICPYDIVALGASVTEHARQSHPVLVDRGQYRGSTSYSGAYYVNDLFHRSLPTPPAHSEVRSFGAADLGDVTNRVLAAAFRAGLPVEKSQSLAAAIRELAADATAGASADNRATLRSWSDVDAMICEITDRKVTTDPTVGRVEVSTRAQRKGLWMANKTSDLIQVRSDADGTTVRVHTWL